MGYNTPIYDKPKYVFHTFLNKWSRGNIYSKDLLKLFKGRLKSKCWFQSKFVAQFKYDQGINYRNLFLKSLFKLEDLNKMSNLNNWYYLNKNQYPIFIEQIDYLLTNYDNNLFNENKKICKKILKYYTKSTFTSKCEFFVSNVLLKIVRNTLYKLFRHVNNYMINNIENKDKKIKLNKKEKKKLYLGRRFLKNYFWFWYYKLEHKGYFFFRRRFWRKNYDLMYRNWYKKRVKQNINLKTKIIFNIKNHVIDILMNQQIENHDFKLVLNNRLLFLKKIKYLTSLMKKNIGIFETLYNKYDVNLDKKEILILIIYSKLILHYKIERVNFINNLKNKNYNNNLLITNKLPNEGGIIRQLIKTYTSLMYHNKGSDFYWTWDYFSYINKIKRIGTKSKHRLIKSGYLKNRNEKWLNILTILDNKCLGFAWRYNN